MQSELRAKRDALESLWRQGLSGRNLLHRHSQLIDEYLADCFAKCPDAEEGITLIAMGGYGRKELFPFSDIDLLLLYDPKKEKKLEALTEALFYPLWDAGLEVGHGVRTPKACLADAKDDFFLQVSLLDARPLTGAQTLFDNLQNSFKKKFVEGHRKDFLKNMILHREERHKRFGKSSYQLEPHIKEGRGGFRDIQAMLWTAKVVFGLEDLADMEEAGLLTEQERNNFEEAWDNLIRIRNRLHYISGRKNDQLYFEHQEEMAKAFKYRSDESLLGVERFMRDVYGHLQAIATTTDLFFEHVDESLGLTPKKKFEQTLEPGITIRQGRLHFTDKNLLEKRPYLLIRIFLQAAKTGLPIHHRDRKIITSYLHLIDDKMRHSRRMAKAFLEILQEAKDPITVLTSMLETGLLTAYIPEFYHVESLAQHDIYHAYTVDRHLLQTVAELKKLQEKDQTFINISSPHVLYLAALFHDIGKGQDKDHSEHGAELITAVAKRLGLSDDDTACLSFLIREHLFLMVTASRRDIEDEQFILECANKIKDPDRLHMLYLLSIADSRATGPTVWSDWKAALLLEFYLKIAHLLDQPELAHPDKSQGADWMRSQVNQLLEGKSQTKIDDLPEDYLMSFKPETIVEHLSYRKQLTEQKALLFHEDLESYWSILIMAKDHTGLLSKICGTLALHNLNVVDAQIFTWADGTAVDVLNVHPLGEFSYEDQDWKTFHNDLNLALSNRLGLAHRLDEKLRSSRYGIKNVGIRPDPKVVIDNNTSTFYTIIEVYTAELPGMLYNITRTIADFGINIYRAKIGVERDQVVDVFYTLDSGGEKIKEQDFQEEIRLALLHTAETSDNI